MYNAAGPSRREIDSGTSEQARNVCQTGLPARVIERNGIGHASLREN